MALIDVSVEKVGDVAVVTLPGEELDASNTPEFKKEVESVLEANRKVVFDLGQLQFVDSSGCGAILSCLRHTNERGGDLKLCNVTKPVRALFELIRMHRIFEIHNSRDEAVEAFGM